MSLTAAEIIAGDEMLGPRLQRALLAPAWLSQRNVLPMPSEVELLKYRPGRRLCARVRNLPGTDQSDAMLKLWYNRRGERIHARLAELGQRVLERLPAAPEIPLPLFYEPAAHALVYQRMPGQPLTRLLRQGLSREWVQPLAAALHWLHSAPVSGLNTRHAADEHDLVLTQMDAPDSPGLDADLRDALSTRLGQLHTCMPEPQISAVLHRDFYDQQVLVSTGYRLGLLDLDDLALGDPMLDLGNFIAHLHVITHWSRRASKIQRVRARLLRAYAREAALAPELLISRLAWFEAVSLLRLVLIQQRRGNPALIPLLLSSASDCIGDTMHGQGARTHSSQGQG